MRSDLVGQSIQRRRIKTYGVADERRIPNRVGDMSTCKQETPSSECFLWYGGGTYP